MGFQLSGVGRGRHENIVTASRSPLCHEEDDPNDVATVIYGPAKTRRGTHGLCICGERLSTLMVLYKSRLRE